MSTIKAQDLLGEVFPLCFIKTQHNTKMADLQGHQPSAQGLDPVTLGEGIYTIHLEASNVAIIDAGVVAFPGGGSYQGALSGGKRCGIGRWVSANGDEYSGAWEADKRSGRGVQRYAASAKGGVFTHVYDGEWEADKRHGLGRETFPDGSSYEGRFDNNRIHGLGLLTLANGDTYEGHFMGDAMDGQGIYTYAASGDTVAGTWSNGQRHGESVVTYKATGKAFRCVWAMDTPGPMVALPPPVAP